jgi:hypothetical protein
MTTMLENMARAMYEAEPGVSPSQGPQWDWEWMVGEGWTLPDAFRRRARAAFTAIREPETDVLKAGVAGADAVSYECDGADPWFQLEMKAGTYAPECMASFTAIIDAILTEEQS